MADDAGRRAGAMMDDWRAAITRAHEMVVRLCLPRLSAGHREWLMSIPADPERDPDLVIAAGLDAGDKALDALAAAERRCAALAEAATALVAAWGNDEGELADWSPEGVMAAMARLRALLRDDAAPGAVPGAGGAGGEDAER